MQTTSKTATVISTAFLLKHEIEPRAVAGLHLGPHPVIAFKSTCQAVFDGQLDQPVGHHGVDPHQRIGHVDHLPGVLQLSFGVVMIGKINRPPGIGTGPHGPPGGS